MDIKSVTFTRFKIAAALCTFLCIVVHIIHIVQFTHCAHCVKVHFSSCVHCGAGVGGS